MSSFHDHIHCYLLACEQSLEDYNDVSTPLSLHDQGMHQGVNSMMARIVRGIRLMLKNSASHQTHLVKAAANNSEVYIKGIIEGGSSLARDPKTFLELLDALKIKSVVKNILNEGFHESAEYKTFKHADYVAGFQKGIQKVPDMLKKIKDEYEFRYDPRKHSYDRTAYDTFADAPQKYLM